MKKERQTIKLSDMVLNTGQLEWLPRNPRQWGKDELDSLIRSLEEDPDYMDDRPPLVTPCEGKYLVFAGNMRTTAEQKRKARKSLECVVYFPEDKTDQQTIVRRAAKDNGSWGKYDWDILANEWDDLPLTDWGVPAWETGIEAEGQAGADDPVPEKEEIERKKKEFEERIAAGEIREEDEEYQEFLEKFKLKKTTDDCYTPDRVYDAVADWVANEYGLDRVNFVRPFFPGGDYQKVKYKPTDIVVDNPPFSIMSEILRFYTDRGVRFFLFAPHLVLFSSICDSVTSLCCGVSVTYANGAVVNTSFQTNLEKGIRARSCPSLRWELSPKEIAIIDRLNKKLGKK